MKILMVSNMYPSDKYPNYGVFVKNFEGGLIEFGHEVDKIVMTKTEYKSYKILKYALHYVKIFINGIIGEYDLIYVHYVSHNALPLLALRKFKNINIYGNLHGSDLFPEKNSQKKFMKFTKALLGIADKIIVPSNYFKEQVKKIYSCRDENIFVYPSGGIDEEIFEDSNLSKFIKFKEENGLSLNERIIGYVGRIDIDKGWDTFLDSIYELVLKNKINLKSVIIVGNGAEREEFFRRIKQYELERYIVYIDMLPQKDLNLVYRCIDIFCFPTRRQGESLGLVALEAMYCKCVIVGSDFAAVKEYVLNNYNGYLCKVGVAEEHTSSICKLLDLNNNELDAMKENSFLLASKYTKNNIRSLMDAIFR